MKRYLGPILTGIAAIVLIVIGVVWLVGQISAVAGATPAASWRTPGEQTMTLEPGEYAVSEAVGFSSYSNGGTSGTGSGSQASRASIVSNTDVTVTGPQGAVLTRCANCGFGYEELTTNGQVYAAVTHFDVPSTGSYTVKVTTDGADVIVNESVSSMLSSVFSGIVPSMGLMVFGGLLFFVALVWLVVLLFTRKKGAKSGVVGSYPGAGVPPGAAGVGTQSSPGTSAQPITAGVPMTGPVIGNPSQPGAASGPAPGWYPDPNDSQIQRWWNGSGWTSETYKQ